MPWSWQMQGITKDFDDFVRGWIGTGRNYPKGVIHFAPCVDSGNISLLTGLLTRWKCSGKRCSGRNGGTGLREPVGTALICDPYGFTERGTKALPPAAAKENAGGQSCPAQERKPTTTIGGDFLSINHIETEDLRRMEGKGGLILQGCGSELQEWLDGIKMTCSPRPVF